MELTTIWFIVIAALWVGYFVLEGFDFGVGILLRVLGRDEPERRAVITTIGPVWDGNEVWLIVAGGATFAAFPEWYATLFSGFYLPRAAAQPLVRARRQAGRPVVALADGHDDHHRVGGARAAVGDHLRQPGPRRTDRLVA